MVMFMIAEWRYGEEMKKIFLSQYQHNDNKVSLYIPTIAIYELVTYLQGKYKKLTMKDVGIIEEVTDL